MNTKSKMKMVMFMLLLSLIIPQVTFALCNNIPSKWYNPVSWLPACEDSSGVVSGDLQGQNSNTINNGTPNSTSLTYSGSGVGGVFDLFQGFLSRALILLISLAVVWFVWNVFHYVIAADEVDKATAKDKMVWGIIAIFVMVSIWGLVAILQSTFKISPGGAPSGLQGIMPRF